ncbi:uncharacterized protein LOC116960169 [Tyto alba]|uniref:uncharacterized protein LOC116960169 n=1 Tax=Tyto alba TaxID=56313 RepID=UPI001C66A04E|nr:uncharacterized protein LOC116960169 [Tyto alba]
MVGAASTRSPRDDAERALAVCDGHLGSARYPRREQLKKREVPGGSPPAPRGRDGKSRWPATLAASPAWLGTRRGGWVKRLATSWVFFFFWFFSGAAAGEEERPKGSGAPEERLGGSRGVALVPPPGPQRTAPRIQKALGRPSPRLDAGRSWEVRPLEGPPARPECRKAGGHVFLGSECWEVCSLTSPVGWKPRGAGEVALEGLTRDAHFSFAFALWRSAVNRWLFFLRNCGS